MAGLYRLLQRNDEALAHARRATAAARRVDVSIVVSKALQCETGYLNLCGRTAEARQAIAEALSLIAEDKMYDQIRAGFLIQRADCALRCDAFADCERDLEQAFALLQPLADLEIAAGVHGDLAGWWAITAKLRRARDDLEGSVAAWQEAVSISKHVASLPQVEKVYTKVAIAYKLQGLAEALRASDRVEDAVAALKERSEILRSVGLPENDA